jgi:hypothetical protein
MTKTSVLDRSGKIVSNHVSTHDKVSRKPALSAAERQSRRLDRLRASGADQIRLIAPLDGHDILREAAKLMMTGVAPIEAMRQVSASRPDPAGDNRKPFWRLIDLIWHR